MRGAVAGGIRALVTARALGLLLAALILLPGAALGQAPTVRIDRVTLDGSTTRIPLAGIFEGQTIRVWIRVDAPKERHMKLRFKVDDDPNLDFLNKGYEKNDPHEGVGEGTLTRLFYFPSGTSSHTIKIDTKVDPKKCRDGQIKITLVEGDTEKGGNQGNYKFPPGSGELPGARTRTTIPVRDAGPCSTISIDPDQALERDGITEGGALDATLKRVSPKLNEPKVTLNWEVVDDAGRDFLPVAEEGRKSHDLPAYVIRFGGPQNAEYEAQVQTRIDPGSGGGTVTVRLLESDYYLGTKTTLVVPVKDDTGYTGRVLSIPDPKVAEDHSYRVGLSYTNGLQLPVQLSDDMGNSATNPSVRVSLVDSGGGCEATASAQDLRRMGAVPRPDPPAIDSAPRSDPFAGVATPRRDTSYAEPFPALRWFRVNAAGAGPASARAFMVRGFPSCCAVC